MPGIAPRGDDRLSTPRFLVMCGFSFTVFFSVFELIPTTAFRIRELGAGTSMSRSLSVDVFDH